MDLTSLEKKIKVQFKDPKLLQAAITHRSYLNEHRAYSLPHNERLEFLGDAVLELVTTQYLYQNFENPEGELTNLRSALVNYRLLAQIAKSLDIEEYLLLSRGEAKDTGRAREVILANAIEALIGAIYLDQGMEKAKEFIADFILSQLSGIMQNQEYLDPKSRLQEFVQDKMSITPVYGVISETGPDHAKVFIVGVYIGEKEIGRGEGRSKQDAEIEAAKDALQKQAY